MCTANSDLLNCEFLQMKDHLPLRHPLLNCYGKRLVLKGRVISQPNFEAKVSKSLSSWGWEGQQSYRLSSFSTAMKNKQLPIFLVVGGQLYSCTPVACLIKGSKELFPV